MAADNNTHLHGGLELGNDDTGNFCFSLHYITTFQMILISKFKYLESYEFLLVSLFLIKNHVEVDGNVNYEYSWIDCCDCLYWLMGF